MELECAAAVMRAWISMLVAELRMASRDQTHGEHALAQSTGAFRLAGASSFGGPCAREGAVRREEADGGGFTRGRDGTNMTDGAFAAARKAVIIYTTKGVTGAL